MTGIFSRERITAQAGFNRWWNVVGALGINLCIGQAYAFSVFNLPLTRVVGINESTPDDWKLTNLGWIFTLAYVFLGLSACFGGRWQERVGPRLSGVVAAFCWSGGFLLAALGVRLHAIWLLYVGYGIVGGCGLGLGFNTPISTLIRWFPDRRGMATGAAIMGFGGGAILAAPVSHALMSRFATETSVGVAETFLVLGATYFVVMIAGSFLFRLPPSGLSDSGPGDVSAPTGAGPSGPAGMPASEAIGTRQFYLLWGVLFLNVTAGIGVLGQASAMIQDVFPGFSASAAAAFVASLSFFNMAGRFLWASLSDIIGRKVTYAIFFSVGPLLYALVPFAAQVSSLVLFVGCFAVILAMYGGGFASLPAYVADVFGARDVGAIHGRLLTALSAAGVVGPVLINYIREYQIAHGVVGGHAYDVTMYIMASGLILGFFVNRAVTPVRASSGWIRE